MALNPLNSSNLEFRTAGVEGIKHLVKKLHIVNNISSAELAVVHISGCAFYLYCFCHNC